MPPIFGDIHHDCVRSKPFTIRCNTDRESEPGVSKLQRCAHPRGTGRYRRFEERRRNNPTPRTTLWLNPFTPWPEEHQQNPNQAAAVVPLALHAAPRASRHVSPKTHARAAQRQINERAVSARARPRTPRTQEHAPPRVRRVNTSARPPAEKRSRIDAATGVPAYLCLEAVRLPPRRIDATAVILSASAAIHGYCDRAASLKVVVRPHPCRSLNVSSAIPLLSNPPRPRATILSYCSLVAAAKGKFSFASAPSTHAMVESLAACAAEK
jgi:hypothetical protein